jgi:hypothetical protein
MLEVGSEGDVFFVDSERCLFCSSQGLHSPFLTLFLALVGSTLPPSLIFLCPRQRA